MRTTRRQIQNQRRRSHPLRWAYHRTASDWQQERQRRSVATFEFWLRRGADWSVAFIAGIAEL